MLDLLIHPAARFILAGLITNAIIAYAAFKWGHQRGMRDMFFFYKQNKDLLDWVDKTFADLVGKLDQNDTNN